MAKCVCLKNKPFLQETKFHMQKTDTHDSFEGALVITEERTHFLLKFIPQKPEIIFERQSQTRKRNHSINSRYRLGIQQPIDSNLY